jgi:hypothetical protein
MAWAFHPSDIAPKTLLAATVIAAAAALSGCWDDTCPEGCAPGYACYYGECLSRGFCPLGTDNSTNCAQYDGDGRCIQEVEHGICDRGFVCVCEGYDPATERCARRSCLEETRGD